MSGDPLTDVEARLRQIRDEIDALLDGERAREVDGRTVGELDDIYGVVFGLASDETADVGVVQEPASKPPAPVIKILGEFLDGLAAGTGYEPLPLAAHAIEVMEASKDSEEYGRSASFSGGDGRE